MNLKASTTSPPTPAKTETATIPRAPQEIIDEILGHLATDSEAVTSLRSCSLVSKSWVPTCQQHLFHTITFTSWKTHKWLKVFPVPEESPAHYVRDLSIRFGGRRCVPGELFQSTPWVWNVRKVSLLGRRCSAAYWAECERHRGGAANANERETGDLLPSAVSLRYTTRELEENGEER